jgi:3-hydroxyisobutyrate dehydrogenase-like beta-hydroxyacid dehydrogenase
MKTPALRTIGIIGFGEAGGILGAELARKRGLAVRTYDILLEDKSRRAGMVAKAEAASVTAAPSHAAAVAGADLVLSAVTAASSFDVARTVARHLSSGQYFLDLNSVSPETKRRSAALIEAGGADYVEAAVMAAVPPKRLAVPMLIGGKKAAALATILKGLGFEVTPVADRIGVASAIKMCRSVMIKGLEALTVECMLGARRYGAEAQVLASLHETFPDMGWNGELPGALIGRIAEHGRRRAAEMREVAATLEDGGIAARMAPTTAALHDWFVDALAAAGLPYDRKSKFDWQKAIDALLAPPPARRRKAS